MFIWVCLNWYLKKSLLLSRSWLTFFSQHLNLSSLGLLPSMVSEINCLSYWVIPCNVMSHFLFLLSRFSVFWWLGYEMPLCRPLWIYSIWHIELFFFNWFWQIYHHLLLWLFCVVLLFSLLFLRIHYVCADIDMVSLSSLIICLFFIFFLSILQAGLLTYFWFVGFFSAFS